MRSRGTLFKAAYPIGPDSPLEEAGLRLPIMQQMRSCMLLLDQAGWHGSGALFVPANITLLPLPSKCPELNPVENIWQFMRENWLSNRIFKSYADILDHCCCAWNRLVDQPWRIISIGLRSWAHG